jgi:hypothetical protein
VLEHQGGPGSPSAQPGGRPCPLVFPTPPCPRTPSEVPGANRLLGRTQAELADAMTWLAWYAPGVYNAVMDYADHVNGELSPASR